MICVNTKKENCASDKINKCTEKKAFGEVENYSSKIDEGRDQKDLVHQEHRFPFIIRTSIAYTCCCKRMIHRINEWNEGLLHKILDLALVHIRK